MTLDELMNRFRVASRELFNNYFRVPVRSNNSTEAWDPIHDFSEVQNVLFETLVAHPSKLPLLPYGACQPSMVVTLRPHFAPIMLNREVDSGYWDYPLNQVAADALLLFIEYFDWDQLAVRDNQYVRVKVDNWASHPEAVGKHALIDSHYVWFDKA
jgi:hypothetical protein